MVSTRTISSSTTRIVRGTGVPPAWLLAEASADIIFCLLLPRSLKDVGSRSVLYELATQEEASELRDTRSLLSTISLMYFFDSACTCRPNATFSKIDLGKGFGRWKTIPMR